MIYTSDMINTINHSFMPSVSKTISRYMGFERFKQLVETSTLWFSNAENFMDKNEGEIPLSFFEGWSDEEADGYKTLQNLKSQVYAAYISCWFEYTRESEPMWLAYGGNKTDSNYRDSNGICIISNVSKLAAYTNYLESVVYQVKYIDLEEKEVVVPPFFFGKKVEERVPVFSARVFYVYKQKEYQDENEIRAITFAPNKTSGLAAKIDIKDFIDHIIINPHATEEQRIEIIEFLKKHSIDDKLIDSKIKSRC